MLPLILLSFVVLCETKGPHHPTTSHHHYHPQPSAEKKLTNDENILHDKKHIEEDLGEWSHDSHLTDEEVEFRYFTAHDYDNNTHLDGIEIFHAIKHSMEAENAGYDSEQWSEKERTIVKVIDQVLREDDTNNDGYLSYIEYVVGRQKDRYRRR